MYSVVESSKHSFTGFVWSVWPISSISSIQASLLQARHADVRTYNTLLHYCQGQLHNRGERGTSTIQSYYYSTVLLYLYSTLYSSLLYPNSIQTEPQRPSLQPLSSIHYTGLRGEQRRAETRRANSPFLPSLLTLCGTGQETNHSQNTSSCSLL